MESNTWICLWPHGSFCFNVIVASLCARRPLRSTRRLTVWAQGIYLQHSAALRDTSRLLHCVERKTYSAWNITFLFFVSFCSSFPTGTVCALHPPGNTRNAWNSQQRVQNEWTFHIKQYHNVPFCYYYLFHFFFVCEAYAIWCMARFSRGRRATQLAIAARPN